MDVSWENLRNIYLETSMGKYPLVMTNIAIERSTMLLMGKFTLFLWSFSIAMLDITRGYLLKMDVFGGKKKHRTKWTSAMEVFQFRSLRDEHHRSIAGGPVPIPHWWTSSLVVSFLFFQVRKNFLNRSPFFWGFALEGWFFLPIINIYKLYIYIYITIYTVYIYIYIYTDRKCTSWAVPSSPRSPHFLHGLRKLAPWKLTSTWRPPKRQMGRKMRRSKWCKMCCLWNVSRSQWPMGILWILWFLGFFHGDRMGFFCKPPLQAFWDMVLFENSREKPKTSG